MRAVREFMRNRSLQRLWSQRGAAFPPHIAWSAEARSPGAAVKFMRTTDPAYLSYASKAANPATRGEIARPYTSVHESRW